LLYYNNCLKKGFALQQNKDINVTQLLQ